ncbi:unnamed protein product [Lupinus luteus]|uniref:Uncharacterized protein n=1 Tax=Lupinus luteus TaxID=3873 RepID=A0AAV1X8U8_LUPLU
MERGLKFPQSEQQLCVFVYYSIFFISQFTVLLSVQDKKSIQLEPEDNLHVEGFALNVFGKADKQDRAGRADLNTAKTFYASSIFFEILNQFGALQPDLEQKQKYAVWKAAEIRKALIEGRKPVAGSPDGDEDLSIPPSTPNNRYDPGTNGTTVTSPGPESDPSHNYDNPVNYQNLPTAHPAPKFHDTVNDQHSSSIPSSMQFYDGVNNNKHSSNFSPSSHPYASTGYPSQDYHPPPPPSQDYHTPSSHDYHSHETSSYPHFQSAPSFTENNLPSVPSNYTYYQSSNASYSTQSSAQHSPSSRNGIVLEPNPTAQTYEYDGNYQPTPEKIAEAHKAARFAVGALAFDDLSVAVDYLKKSLELLTKSIS